MTLWPQDLDLICTFSGITECWVLSDFWTFLFSCLLNCCSELSNLPQTYSCNLKREELQACMWSHKIKGRGSRGLAFIFKSSEGNVLLPSAPPTPTWIKIIHFFLRHKLNVSRGSQWYLTTWRTNGFFSPLRHSCFKSHYSAYERRAIKASTSLLFPLTSLMRNIFQPNRNAFFYLPLIAFKWIPWSEEKKIQICFLRLHCHMMQVIQFHTHTRRPYWAYVWFYDNFCHSPCKHYCIRVYGLSKANSAVIPDHILWFIPFLTL